MDRSILLLIVAGIALAFLHTPETTTIFAIIAALVMGSIRICWMLIQAFSQSAVQPRTAPVQNS